MSTEWNDDDLNALLDELAPDAAEREVLLEEHRQLEKDLLRLADPLPPADFVQKVMKRVEAAPARSMSKMEVATAASIVTFTLVGAVVALFTAGSGSSGIGLALADLAIRVRDALVAMGSALIAVWNTAAVPVAAAVFVTAGVSLFALRRVAMLSTARTHS